MKSVTPCLQTSDIEALLAGTVPASQTELWEEHFSYCESCRLAMARKVGDQEWWREAEQSLMSDSFPIVRDAANCEAEERESIEELLKLLGPTDDPQKLGRIGSYEVLGVLGRGGMGVVFKAFDAPLNRFVAIKMLLPHLAASGAARKRFAREGQAVAAVVDDHVMAIHCVDEWQGVPYLVMTYSRGVSLQKRLSDNGPLEVREILRIGMQAAKGLAAAHAQGIVHRDIKPANILLEEGVERVTITDFGLARAVDDASMTCSGVIAGTPQYMSPEQARGEPIDARSDLFSLGSVLYAMCAGRSPFRAETTYGVLHRIANDNPTSVCEVNSDVPEWLGLIIERLMAKRAGDRFESAAQVAELLEGCLAHVQQPAAVQLPEAVTALAPKRIRRPPIANFIAAAVGGVALFLAGILIVLELGKGTLTIESEIDDVPIRIVQGNTVVKELTVSREGKTTRIAAGVYTVEVESEFDSAVIENGVVTISRRGTETIKVTRDGGAKVVSYNVSDVLDKDSGMSMENQMEPLVYLIHTTIEPDSWKEHAFSIVPYPQNKSLVVRQNDATHRKIAKLFDQLRERRKQMEDEVSGLLAKANADVLLKIDNLRAQLADLRTKPERSADATRVERELERAESIFKELTTQTQNVHEDADVSENLKPGIFTTPTLAEAAAKFNQQSAEDRRKLFNPPIPDLTEEQLREGFRQAAIEYRKDGESDIAAVLEKIVETGRLPDGVGSNLVASGVTTRNDTGEIETQQIAPALIIKGKNSSHRLVLLRSLELLYRKTGTSSKDYGDAGRSQDHANSEKVSPTLNSHMSNIVVSAEPVPVSTKLWNVAGAVFNPVAENELVTSGWKGGLRVTHVRENGPAEEAMIRIGDIVVEMDGEPIATIEAMDRLRGRTSYGVPLTVRLLRDHKEVLARIKWDQRFLQPLGTGVVQDRDKSTVVVSLGTDDGVHPGDRLNTSSLPLGTLEVVTVTADQCAARIISEDERVPIKKGDLVNYGQMQFLTPPTTPDANSITNSSDLLE